MTVAKLTSQSKTQILTLRPKPRLNNTATYRFGNTNSNNVNSAAFNLPHFMGQSFNFACWYTVGDEHGDIGHIRTVPFSRVEYFRPH